MEKRLLLAVLLTVLVVVITPKLLPRRPVAVLPDSTALSTGGPDTTPRPQTNRADTIAAPRRIGAGGSFFTLTDTAAFRIPAETSSAATTVATYTFSNVGATPVGVQLHQYRDLGPGDGPVQLVRPGVPLLAYRLVMGVDTVPLESVRFTANRSTGAPATSAAGGAPLTFEAMLDSLTVAITYDFVPNSYLVHVTGSVRGRVPPGSAVEVLMPRGLRSQEADTADDRTHRAFVLKPTDDDVESIAFNKLDTAQVRVDTGSYSWMATRNKYFIAVLLAHDAQPPFRMVGMRAWAPVGRQIGAADGMVLQPLDRNGAFGFDLYAGPQEWRRLRALGHELEHANPYGSFLRPIVEPFANVVMRVLLWMHERFSLNYGWVVVIFGVVIRLLLWPLNQKSMRANIRMQQIQPELQEIQRKYKKQPEKQQAEMMKLYQKHGMSPFSMFSGCLPMLLPMPILFALYFVFLNTIEFRGVPFLWMTDISQRDPYWITPIAMGLSMFVMSWIGLRAAPKNPQSRMMAYVMPVAMTAIFWRFAAGLNLYYAVQNIAAIPQQWILARERQKVASK
ncbi:MAG TPA: YidC/Oxa1 family insertase periplasmic-domain containing protein [Gemmatimonadaceae bacterium]|nr:YidC/Oxa1 family insertase periplasmic-domain containing protein [Gemmatimonadaceae bacterium]